LKKVTNFGSRGHSKLAKKRAGKKTRRLGFAVAVIAVLTVVVREIAVDYLKNLRDSINSAESQFEAQSDQNALQMQISILRQQADNAAAKAAAQDPDAEREFHGMIPLAISEVNEARMNLNAEYESVSNLLSKLPPGFKPLRDQLPTAKSTIDKTDTAAQSLLTMKTTTEAQHYANTRLALVIYVSAELPLVILGGVTVDEAKKIEDAAETLIRFCNRLVCGLVAAGAILGAYAAWLTMKEGDE